MRNLDALIERLEVRQILVIVAWTGHLWGFLSGEKLAGQCLFFFGKLGEEFFFKGLMFPGLLGTLSTIVPSGAGIAILAEIGLSVGPGEEGRLASARRVLVVVGW